MGLWFSTVRNFRITLAAFKYWILTSQSGRVPTASLGVRPRDHCFLTDAHMKLMCSWGSDPLAEGCEDSWQAESRDSSGVHR